MYNDKGTLYDFRINHVSLIQSYKLNTLVYDSYI